MASSIMTYFNKQTSPSTATEESSVDYKRVFSEINNSSSSIDSQAVKSPETKRPNTLSSDNEQLNMQFGFLDSVKSMIGELSSTIDSRFLDNTELINSQFSLLTPRFDTIDNRLSSIEEQAGMRDEKINVLSERIEQLEQRNSVLEDRVRELSESCTARNAESGWSPAGSPGIKVKLLGDSNSAGKIKFGSGKGTLGSALSGSDIFVASVDDLLVPAQSQELFSDASDVVIAVGTNNLKNPGCDPTSLVKQLYDYIKTVTSLYTSLHVFLPGVLPVFQPESSSNSDVSTINDNIKHYNYYLKDLCCNHPRLTYIECNMFANNSGGLKPGLAKGGTDLLHLSDQGLKLYFSRIKYALRERHGLPVARRRPAPGSSRNPGPGTQSGGSSRGRSLAARGGGNNGRGGRGGRNG